MTDSPRITGKPRVLFVCVSNRGKSVMGEALMWQRHGTDIDAASAGTEAAIGGSVNELSAQALAEVGADVGDHRPRQLDDALLRDHDRVIVIGSAQVNAPPEVDVEVWEVDEPSRRGIDGIERMRLLRDEIDTRVDDLAARMTSR